MLALVDTAGATRAGAEERGQARIARSTEACLDLGVANVAVVIGEGGSGGAIAIATANKVMMLEHAIYTGSHRKARRRSCKRFPRAQDAATNIVTADDLLRFGIIDGIIAEPVMPTASRR